MNKVIITVERFKDENIVFEFNTNQNNLKIIAKEARRIMREDMKLDFLPITKVSYVVSNEFNYH